MSDYDNISILLVEDTTTDAEMTIRALRKCNLADHLVWVKDGREALDYLQMTGAFANRTPEQPRLILLDIKMPRIDGIEVLRTLKKSDTLRKIPVVMLTSSAEERDVVESYDLGANSYIVKPVNPKAFYQAVSEAGMYWMQLNKVTM